MHTRPPRLQSFRSLLKDQRGATAVEFALVVGPFLIFLGAIIEVGIMLFTEYTLQNAVQEASRQIQTGQMTAATSSDFKTLLCQKAPNLTNCTTALGVGLYVDNAANFTDLATAMQAVTISSIPPGTSAPFNPGAGSRAVAVIATYDWKFTFPFMQVFNNVAGARRLQGVAVFLNEAFG